MERLRGAVLTWLYEVAERTHFLTVMGRTGESSSCLFVFIALLALAKTAPLPSSYELYSYMSGTTLLNAHGEPCNLNHGSDDCEPGLVCIQNRNDITSGTCSAFWEDATWWVSMQRSHWKYCSQMSTLTTHQLNLRYVDWDNDKCVQNCEGGPNCGGYAGNYDEQHSSHTLCCDTHLGWLNGNYGACVPDLDFYLGEGRDCTDTPGLCKGKYKCKMSQANGSDRWFCA